MHIKGSIAVTAALLTSMAATPAIPADFTGGNPLMIPMTLEGDLQKVKFYIEGPSAGLGANGWFVESGQYITVAADFVPLEVDPDPEHANTYEIYVNGSVYEDLEGRTQFPLNERVSILLEQEGKTTVSLKASYWESFEEEVEAQSETQTVINWREASSSSEEVDFFLDTKAPEVNEVSLSGTYREVSGVVYAASTLDVKITGVLPSVSGIEKYELLEGDAVVDTSGTPEFTLENNSADLSVRVVGNNGKVSSTYPVLDRIVFVGQAPGVSLSESGNAFEADGVTWYPEAPSVVAKVVGSHTESVTATVNEEAADLELKMSSSTEEVYEVLLPEGLSAYDVSVTATDRLGQETTETTSFKIDSGNPEITDHTVSGVFHNQDGKTFISDEGINFTIKLADTESGIAKVSLMRDGGTFITQANVNEVSYTLTESGAYAVYLEDNVGNSVTLPLSEITDGGLSEELVSKTSSPGIEIKVPDTAFVNDGKSWFAALPTLEYSVEDPLLESYTVTVNGTEVYKGSDAGSQTLDLAEAGVTPNVNDGSLLVNISSVDKLGNASNKESAVYIDSFAPVIKKFNFTIPSFEGKDIAGEDEYGIYLEGATQGFLEVEDLGPSSGLKAVEYQFIDGDSGSVVSTKTAAIHGNIATLEIPQNFKGYLRATASDNVSNTSKSESPSGLITGPSNFHINNANINIMLPETPYTDGSGLPLYASEGAGKVDISGSRMGIRSISWGIGNPGENVQGQTTVSFDGSVQGDGGYSATKKDKNLVNGASGAFSLRGNANGLQVWVSTVDRAGFESTTVKQFSIDSTAPELTVSYNQTDASGFYNVTRVATLMVRDDNFTPEGVVLTGETGDKGAWVQGADGLWTSTMTFATDGEFSFTAMVTDRAQNKSPVYTSEIFTIDKTAPTVAVAWDGQEPAEGNFYPKARTANLVVVEKNFDPGLVTKTGTGALSGWGRSGDTNSATVTFAEEGPQEFSLSLKDKANNQSDTYDSGKFYIHTETPKITVSGVTAGTSYHQSVGVDVTVEDKFLLKPEVSLTTRGGQVIDLESSFSDGKAFFHMDSLPKDISMDDLYNLEIRAENKAGAVVNSSVPFIVNRFGSQYSFLNEDYLGKFHKDAQDVSIQEFSVEPLDMEQIRLEVSRDSGEVAFSKELSQTEMLTDQNYVHTFMKEIFEQEGDGVYNLAVYSSTEGGSLDNASVSQEYTFVLDTTAPTVIVSGVQGGGTYNTAEQRGTVEVRDAYGLEAVQVLLNGKPLEEIAGHEGLYEFFLGEGAGQSIVVTALDRAGNETILAEEDITVTTNVWEYVWNTFAGRVLLLTGVGALLVLGLVGLRKWRSSSAQQRNSEVWHKTAIVDSARVSEVSNRITSLDN